MRTQNLNVRLLKPGVGQYISIHATLIASAGPFTCIFSKTSPDFSCVSCGMKICEMNNLEIECSLCSVLM